MNRTNRYRKDRKRIAGFFIGNWQLIVFFLLFILGIFWGSNIIKSNSQQTQTLFDSVLSKYTAQRSGQTFFETVVNSLLPLAVLLLGVYFLGTTPFGMPAVFLVPFFRGIGLGVLSGYLYATNGLKGIAYCALTVYPPCVVAVTVLILCCVESYNMSSDMFSLFRKTTRQIDFLSNFKLYSARFCVFFLITFFSCVLDALLNSGFSHLFGF